MPKEVNRMYNLQDMLRRIKEEKKKRNFTNEDLANKANISISTLGKVLAGIIKDPSVATIIKIAIALDVSADYLILGEKSDYEHPAEDSKIMKKYNELNSIGKKKTEIYIDDLLTIPAYTSKGSPSVNAFSDERTYTSAKFDDDEKRIAAFGGVGEDDDTVYTT
jgi:transcriptional regulator with XRE-family HTH domain